MINKILDLKIVLLPENRRHRFRLFRRLRLRQNKNKIKKEDKQLIVIGGKFPPKSQFSTQFFSGFHGLYHIN